MTFQRVCLSSRPTIILSFSTFYFHSLLLLLLLSTCIFWLHPLVLFPIPHYAPFGAPAPKTVMIVITRGMIAALGLGPSAVSLRDGSSLLGDDSHLVESPRGPRSERIVKWLSTFRAKRFAVNLHLRKVPKGIDHTSSRMTSPKS